MQLWEIEAILFFVWYLSSSNSCTPHWTLKSPPPSRHPDVNCIECPPPYLLSDSQASSMSFFADWTTECALYMCRPRKFYKGCYQYYWRHVNFDLRWPFPGFYRYRILRSRLPFFLGVLRHRYHLDCPRPYGLALLFLPGNIVRNQTPNPWLQSQVLHLTELSRQLFCI